MTADQSKECMQYVVNLIHEAKQKLDSPYIYVGGDFNQFHIDKALEEHVDLLDCAVGPSRQGRSIDRSFTNFDDRIKEKGSISPLIPNNPESGAPSDHNATYLQSSLEVRTVNQWKRITIRPRSEALNVLLSLK